MNVLDIYTVLDILVFAIQAIRYYMQAENNYFWY